MARIVEAINNGAQNLAYKDKRWDFFLPDYLGERIPKMKSEEQRLAEERAFVDMAIAAGFAVMEKK